MYSKLISAHPLWTLDMLCLLGPVELPQIWEYGYSHTPLLSVWLLGHRVRLCNSVKNQHNTVFCSSHSTLHSSPTGTGELRLCTESSACANGESEVLTPDFAAVVPGLCFALISLQRVNALSARCSLLRSPFPSSWLRIMWPSCLVFTVCQFGYLLCRDGYLGISSSF